MVETHDGIVPAMQAAPEFFRDIVTDKFGVDDVEATDWFDEVPGKGRVLHEEGRNQFIKTLLGTIIKDTSVLSKIQGETTIPRTRKGLRIHPENEGFAGQGYHREDH